MWNGSFIYDLFILNRRFCRLLLKKIILSVFFWKCILQGTKYFWPPWWKNQKFAFLNPFPSKGFPIAEQNRLALDRVKSISALSAHLAVKGLKSLVHKLKWYIILQQLQTKPHYFLACVLFPFSLRETIIKRKDIFKTWSPLVIWQAI